MSEELGDDEFAACFGFGTGEHAPELDRRVVISYGFLFPEHRQPREHTALEPADDPYSGDYEGDWWHFCVVTRTRVQDPETASIEDFVPTHVAFGQRFRGTATDRDNHATDRSLLRPWSSLRHVDDHAVVAAACGTHNLYPHDSPLNPGGKIDLQWIDFGKSVSEAAGRFVQDAVEQTYSGVMAAKALAGTATRASLGGLAGALVGAVVGGIAAAAEAASTEEEGLWEEPKLGEDAAPELPAKLLRRVARERSI